MKSALVRANLSFRAQAQAHIAVLAANCTRSILRFLHKGATVLPGLVALAIDKNILLKLAEERNIILVTGTNGKTTTVKMLVNLLQAQGLTVVTNPSGANMADGITAAFLENYRYLQAAEQSKTVFVMEIDEAYFSRLAPELPVKIAVCTNLFRDQLDRYGELATTRALIARGLAAKKDTVFITCADDAMSLSLQSANQFRNLTFGLAADAMQPVTTAPPGDGTFCFYCQSKLQYSRVGMAHLGVFRCPKCDFAYQEPTLTFKLSEAQDKAGAQVYFNYKNKEEVSVHFNLPGLHNAYNAACALLCAKTYFDLTERPELAEHTETMAQLGYSQQSEASTLIAKQSKNEAAKQAEKQAAEPLKTSLADLAQPLQVTEAAFGRMERINLPNGKSLCVMLVKNPAGLNIALQFLSKQTDLGALALCLNARINDGKDVSWIWDVDFEQYLPQHKELLTRLGDDYQLYCGGERASDMASRLYYAAYPAARLHICPSYGDLLDQALAKVEAGRCLYILPNYTCMLALREELQKYFDLPEFWKGAK